MVACVGGAVRTVGVAGRMVGVEGGPSVGWAGAGATSGGFSSTANTVFGRWAFCN